MAQVNITSAPNQVLLAKAFADEHDGTFLPLTREENSQYTLHMETEAFDERSNLQDIRDAFATIASENLNGDDEYTPEDMPDGRVKLFNGDEGARSVYLEASQEQDQFNLTLVNE